MALRILAVFALLWVAACTGGPTRPPPSPAGLGLPAISDPVSAAIFNARAALADPPRRIGDNPAYAARTVGQLEFVTAMMGEPRFFAIAPLVQGPLLRGRAEARATLGLAAEAAPQAVIDALAGAAAAIDRGDGAAAERALAPVSATPARSLAVLRALPFMREAANALALAEWSLERIEPIEES
jgi:hypothetical protein